MPRQVTEVRVGERGEEEHESWLLVGAHRYRSTGTRLFDSEIPHQTVIGVTVKRCVRRRELSRDWLFGREQLLTFVMSQAQWGAFVSSFGEGDGVPATLWDLQGADVPQAPSESRLDRSQKEVREAGTKALEEVQRAYEKLVAEFEVGGKRGQRDALKDLGHCLRNAPLNMEFAAKSLTEHVENVVTKAKADIEGMALAAVEQERLQAPALFQLEQGEGKE